MSIVDFATAKARQVNRAIDMKPDQLIKIIADDFESGVFKNPFGLLVLVLDQDEDGNPLLNTYRAGVNSAEELGYLRVWERERIDDLEKPAC